MKKQTILSVMAVLCQKKLKALLLLALLYFIMGQLQAQEIKPLKVGDKLPESFWQQEYAIYHNGKTTKQNLSPYRSKLLILDFWATWCGSCLGKFNALQQLQANYLNEVKIMLVNAVATKDKPLDISLKLSGKKEPFKSYTLPSIISDTLLVKKFPHQLIPNYVWIINGVVCAITNSDFLTEENLKQIILQNKAIAAKREARLLLLNQNNEAK